MDLQAVQICNFLSIERQVVHYTGNGVTLVCGDNGSGKSALFVEPLLWLFYGSLNRTPLAKFAKQPVKRRYRQVPVDGETSVEAWFEHCGSSYYVKRTLETGYTVMKDNVAVTPYLEKTDGAELVTDIVKLPENLFRAIAVMGQGFSSRFSGFGESERSSVIEDFIGAAVFEEAQTYTGSVNDQLRGLVSGAQSRKATAEQSLARTVEQLRELREQLSNEQARIDAAKLALETESGEVSINFAANQQAATIVNDQLASVDGEIAKIETAMQQVTQNLMSMRQQLGTLTGRVASVQGELNVLGNLSGQCSTCYQPVTPEIVARESTTRHNALAHLDMQVRQTTRDIQGQESANLGNQQALVPHRTSRGLLVAEQSRLRDNGTMLTNRLYQIQRELVNLGSQLTNLQQAVTQAESRETLERGEVQAVETELAEYARLGPYASWWFEHFSVRGLRSWRMGSVLETMNGHLADYSNRLFDGAIQVRLLPVKPQKTAKAKSVVSIDVTSAAGCYEMSSGGQCRNIDLAIHFALRRLAQNSAFGWSSNFVIADEVFDHLDGKVAERALDVLRDEAPRVFLVTHSQALRSKCNSVMHVSLEDEKTVVNTL